MQMGGRTDPANIDPCTLVDDGRVKRVEEWVERAQVKVKEENEMVSKRGCLRASKRMKREGKVTPPAFEDYPRVKDEVEFCHCQCKSEGSPDAHIPLTDFVEPLPSDFCFAQQQATPMCSPPKMTPSDEPYEGDFPSHSRTSEIPSLHRVPSANSADERAESDEREVRRVPVGRTIYAVCHACGLVVKKESCKYHVTPTVNNRRVLVNGDVQVMNSHQVVGRDTAFRHHGPINVPNATLNGISSPCILRQQELFDVGKGFIPFLVKWPKFSLMDVPTSHDLRYAQANGLPLPETKYVCRACGRRGIFAQDYRMHVEHDCPIVEAYAHTDYVVFMPFRTAAEYAAQKQTEAACVGRPRVKFHFVMVV